ncbi:hypothetical protein LRP50_05275 [Enterovibrio sp. ZSDZ42]|uniref:Uncharacterized protein n=1 Tax=Enterovibrio gelatinilyticus TaxID=2899819 RepID=A0ABT5QWZ8_9GAMM|nr:hypothetical protein [Enterovibrio sp. ZSDZ42]MDD1792538.1 hypothetical protein [Enterovibrio sp. ZSDZ42]
MTECLRCPQCDEVSEVLNEMENPEKGITVFTSHCDYCDKPLYHIEGENGKTLQLKGALKAQPTEYDESDWLSLD